ncbi:group I intron-associated PD-(D/E)XK endonuclease [Streptococcus infantis]|uniref:group I intron-associated PD-(D/E)XK endonuclease n=1 Tax=Streptococcus infantis TaxID=68892 RepID=UPI0039C4092C
MGLEEDIRKDIILINNNISRFDNKDEIIRYLKKKFDTLTNFEKEQLWEDFKNENFIKSRIPKIAIEKVLYKKHVEDYLESKMLNIIKEKCNESSYDSLSEVMSESLLAELDFSLDKKETKILKKRLSKSIISLFPLILSDGFSTNLSSVDTGTMTSNAGDSAQFLFIARAILAGFDSSNVDVRTSRYDAIVGYKGKTFRVQVKGISGNTIYFKDRARGGQGIDYTHERNKGRRITKEDCDIYAAVNKKNGLVYLIPIEVVEQSKEKVSTNEMKKYLENWSIFDKYLKYWSIFGELVNQKLRTRKWKARIR